MSPFLPLLLAILLCYLYIIMAQFFLHRKCNYIHETAVAILLGALLGIFITLFTNVLDIDQYGQLLRNVIILVLLPPMLFEDGYNIRKRKFFQNIAYINLYGIVGTIVHFVIVFAVVYAFNYYTLIRTINNQPLHLRVWQILAMASCLCSIDTVVPEKIVNPQRYPKLFSIIFGESIMKDTVCITLFDSIVNVYAQLSFDSAELDATVVGKIVLKFVEVIVCSIMIGIGCALVTTLLFKNLRFLMAQKGVAEVALIALTGYAAYILSEWGTFSGVISMLFCGITLSHFNIYNLTPQGKSATKITVSTLALLAEGLLFFFLGAFIFSIQFSQADDKDQQSFTFSWSLLLVIILALLLARLVNVYLLSLVGYLIIGKKKWRLNKYEYQILLVSGMVKGAIPFALILSLPQSTQNFQTNCIQNIVILVVFLTSMFLNSLLPKILRNRLSKIDQMVRFNVNHPSLYDSLIVEYQKMELQYHNHERENEGLNTSLSKSDKSQINSQIQQRAITAQKFALYNKLKSTTQKYWKRCEEGFLKPLLIYDYYNRKQQIKMEKIKMRKQEAREFWKRYRPGGYAQSQNEEQNTLIDMKLIDNDMQANEQAPQNVLDEIDRHSSGIPLSERENIRAYTTGLQQMHEIKVSKSKTQGFEQVDSEGNHSRDVIYQNKNQQQGEMVELHDMNQAQQQQDHAQE